MNNTHKEMVRNYFCLKKKIRVKSESKQKWEYQRCIIIFGG